MSTQQPLRLTDFASFDVTVERTASGGFGVVFMGPDRLHNGQWFALKTLRPELLRIAPRARDLIVREGLTWIGLWPHAYVLIANTVTQINTQPFLVLNYAAGGSLRDLMATFPGGLLPQRTGLRLAQHIAAGLDALHTAAPEFLRPEPLVHRDLKPENVLMHESGLAEITDFGLAKVVAVVAEDDPRVLPAIGGEGDTTRSRRYQTRKGAALGTIQYMAPEQWEDAASAEPPADMYAFGLMLSELLASRHALLDLAGCCGEAEWRAAHAQPAPRRLRAVVPELPMALEELFHACLTARPEQRPTAREALSVLQRTAETLGQDAYIPAEVVPHTPANEQILWQNWANAHAVFELYAEALERNNRALALAPRDSNVLSTRGRILAELGRMEEALTAYDTALAALSPDEARGGSVIGNQRGNY